MTFDWPTALLGLLAIPVLAGVYVLAARRRRRDAERFANPALVPNLVASAPGWRRWVPPALALASLALLVVGIARPHVVRDVTRNEATIVLAMDTSRSMQAADVQPSRFARRSRRRSRSWRRCPMTTAWASSRSRPPPTLSCRRRSTGRRHAPRSPSCAWAPGPRSAAINRSVDLALDREGDEPAVPRAIAPRPPSCSSPTAPRRPVTSGRAGAQRARQLGVPVSTVALGTGEAVVEVPRPGGLSERSSSRPTSRPCARSRRRPAGRSPRRPTRARLEAVYRELGTRLARDRKRVEVTSAFAAGGAVLLLVGGTLSTLWFGGHCEAPAARVRRRPPRGSSGRRGEARAADECRGLMTCLPVTGRGSRSLRRSARSLDRGVGDAVPVARLHRRRHRRARQRSHDRRQHPRRERSCRAGGHDRGRGALHRGVHGRPAAADRVPAVHRLHPHVGRRRPG